MEGWRDVDRTLAGAALLNLPLVDCPFTDARARGRAHGESLRGIIRDKIGRWRSSIEEDYGEAPSSFITRLLAHTRFDAAIARHTPELADEVHGVAEGANIDHNVACALQLMDEEWWFGRASHEGHCSSAGFAPGDREPTVLGQTMDLPAWHDGAQALLRLRNADDSQTLMFTSAGMIGLMGVAGHGLGLCVNTLAGLRSRLDGLPVAYVVRGALAARDTTAAARFLCEIPHASGQNYTIADRQTVRAFECSAAGAVELKREDGRLLHANDPLASVDWRTGPVTSGNSAARLVALRGECEENLGPWAETLKAALCSRRDGAAISIRPATPAKPSSLMSIGGVVYEIGDVIRFWVSAGPPSPESWRETAIRGPTQ
jgi:isopenicillin-N N-acyltransferase like protein